MRVLRWAVQTPARYIGMIRIEAKDDHHLQRTSERGTRNGALSDARAGARGTRYRGHHSGRDRGGDHGGIDCEAAERGAELPHELVQQRGKSQNL